VKRTPFWLWVVGAFVAAYFLHHAIGDTLDLGAAWTVLVAVAHMGVYGYLCAERARDAGKENIALWVFIGVVPFGIFFLGCAPSAPGAASAPKARQPRRASCVDDWVSPVVNEWVSPVRPQPQPPTVSQTQVVVSEDRVQPADDPIHIWAVCGIIGFIAIMFIGIVIATSSPHADETGQGWPRPHMIHGHHHGHRR
jgi:hypothetical protein